MKSNQSKPRNFFAKELREDKYFQRVVPSYKKYNRSQEKRNFLKEFHAT